MLTDLPFYEILASNLTFCFFRGSSSAQDSSKPSTSADDYEYDDTAWERLPARCPVWSCRRRLLLGRLAAHLRQEHLDIPEMEVGERGEAVSTYLQITCRREQSCSCRLRPSSSLAG